MEANPPRTETVNEEKQDQVWTARSRCPIRLKDTVLSVMCYRDALFFSPLSRTFHPSCLVTSSNLSL